MAREKGCRVLKILLLAHEVPFPPHGGSLIRIWQQILFFGQRHRLTLALLAQSPAERQRAHSLERYCEAVKVVDAPGPDSLRPGQPRTVEQCRSPELEEVLRSLAAESWDAVLIHRIFMAQYAGLFSAPTVIDEHNIESDVVRQYASLAHTPRRPPQGGALAHTPRRPPQGGAELEDRMRWRSEALLLQAYETRWWPRFALRVTVSEVDRQRLERRGSMGRTVVAPNGADCSRPPRSLKRESRCILFCGLLTYRPNQDAVERLVEEVMPEVWSRCPGIRLIVAGTGPTPALRALCGSDPRIELVIDPAEMEPVADRCSALVVPLRFGSGTRLKILEAFAWGLPVIATPLACEGLPTEDGRELLIREDPAGIAAAVIELHDRADLWQRLRKQGRELVESRYDWVDIWSRLETELYSLAGITA